MTWTRVSSHCRLVATTVISTIYCLVNCLYITSEHSETMWYWISRSILVQVMACRLTAPSLYLNQCWRTTNGVLWQSFQGNVTWILRLSPPPVLCLDLPDLNNSLSTGTVIKTNIGIRTWINNYIHVKLWFVITHPCPNFNGGLLNSLRPSDAYMRQQTNHHWFR